MDLRQNVENMHEWIGSFSIEMETIKKSQIEMLGVGENKQNNERMNAFDGSVDSIPPRKEAVNSKIGQ